MFNNVRNGVSGNIHYRGGTGHLNFLMQRLSGLGTLAFLSMHLLLESTAHFIPRQYDQLNDALRNPLVLLAEVALAFLVIFHGVNGFRIAYFDLLRPGLWSPLSAPKAARAAWTLSFLLWLPVLVIMALRGLHIL